jgi:hypothetical protein
MDNLKTVPSGALARTKCLLSQLSQSGAWGPYSLYVMLDNS